MAADLTTPSGSGMRKKNYQSIKKSKRGLYYTNISNRVTILTLREIKEN